MAQVFPPGPAPKVPRSSHSAVPAHIHTCKLSRLLVPFPKPSREQVRQPGAQTSPASTTPHPAPHRLYTKWKDSHCLCLPKAPSSEGKHSRCSRARQPGPKGGGVGDAHHLCGEGSPPAGASGPSRCTRLQHRHPFGLLGSTGCPSSKKTPTPICAQAASFCCSSQSLLLKRVGQRGFRGTLRLCLERGQGWPPAPCWLSLQQHCQAWQITALFCGANPGVENWFLCHKQPPLPVGSQDVALHIKHYVEPAPVWNNWSFTCVLILSLSKREEDLMLLMALENDEFFLYFFFNFFNLRTGLSFPWTASF